MLQPILYQNPDRSVTLIDIPTSIAAAQGMPECPASHSLLSCEPLVEPYPATNEPKSDKAKEQIQSNTVDDELHQIYRTLIEDALVELREVVPGDWCLPRKTVAGRPLGPAPQEPHGSGTDASTGTEYAAQTSSNSIMGHSTPDAPTSTAALTPRAESLDPLLRVLSGCNALTNPSFPTHAMSTTVSHRGFASAGLEAVHQGSGSDWESWDCVQHNAKKIPLALSVWNVADIDGESAKTRFKIPPLSAFVLSDCSMPAVFHNAFRDICEDRALASSFEIVLLDPPWPNASARRIGAYSTQQTLKDMRRLILGLGLDSLVSSGGLVGIWITNKPAVRSMMLGKNGLLKQLHLTLEEEWIWLKVTCRGEPAFSLDSHWRKPYEVLLLARSTGGAAVNQEAVNHVKRRVIVAVPDLHSRKPCLKELIEPLLAKGADSAVLEIFARHLVSGWWSWGNEAIKFNWEGQWTSPSMKQSKT